MIWSRGGQFSQRGQGALRPDPANSRAKGEFGAGRGGGPTEAPGEPGGGGDQGIPRQAGGELNFMGGAVPFFTNFETASTHVEPCTVPSSLKE